MKAPQENILWQIINDTYSPRNPSPKATRTRSPTRFRTPFWTPSWRTIRPAAWRAKFWSPPAPASSPARSPPRPTWTFRASRAAPSSTSATTTPPTASTRNTCGVHNLIQSQSPDISMGVDTGGAGDQGLMFGYACDETPELMPLPIMMAHKLCRQLCDGAARRACSNFLRPDGKSQVSVEYVGQQAEAHRSGGDLDAAQPRSLHRRAARAK